MRCKCFLRASTFELGMSLRLLPGAVELNGQEGASLSLLDDLDGMSLVASGHSGLKKQAETTEVVEETGLTDR